MTDPEILKFLTQKRDEAAAKAKDAVDELERREATLRQYLSGPPIPKEDLPPDDEDGDEEAVLQPIRIWRQVLAGGTRLTRQEMYEALKAGGWVRKHEKRSFSKAINTNLTWGNIIRDEDGRYRLTSPEEKERILNNAREQRGVSE